MPDLRVPPHAEEAEKSILGSILIDKDAIVDVAVVIRPEMFYSRANGDIFGAMVALYENRDPIDVLTVADWLKKKNCCRRLVEDHICQSFQMRYRWHLMW